jgi:hypothetical protein
MLVWVTSQSTLVIGLLCFAGSYLMCAAIYWAVRVAARRGHVVAFKATSPVTLTPLAVMFGLLFGFLAADVWPNFEHARAAVGQEAMGLRQALLYSDALAPEERRLVQDGVKEHIAQAVGVEWPAMAVGDHRPESSSDALGKVLTALLVDNPGGGNRRSAQADIVRALERAQDAQRQRLFISRTSVSSIKWFVFMVLAGLIELTIAMIHVENHGTKVITMLIFATAVAVSALLIMSYDRPFGGGGVSVTPDALKDVLAH